MSDELISRQALLDWLAPYLHTGEKVDVVCLIEDIHLMKAIESATVRRGRWEEIRDAYGKLEGWLCPCGREVKSKDNFCPNCGADMRGKDDAT